MNSTGKKNQLIGKFYSIQIYSSLWPQILYLTAAALLFLRCSVIFSHACQSFPSISKEHSFILAHFCIPVNINRVSKINFMNRISLNLSIVDSSLIWVKANVTHATLLENPLDDLSQFSLLTPWYCCIILSNSPEYWLWKEYKRALSSSEAEHLTDLWRLSSKSTHCWCGYKLSHFKD